MTSHGRLQFLARRCHHLRKKQVTFARSLHSEKKDRYAKCPTRVFSGIQPTGVPHLGNYAGAIASWVQLQNTYDGIIVSIVDLHSITISHEPEDLRNNILTMASSLIACGIDPQKSILFQQSMVPYHTELSWIFGCLVSLNRLKHVPQWKEKSVTVKDPSIGLYTYPILQAADILLYKATTVPVGEDQAAHLELARELAANFNRIYSPIFPQCVGHSSNVTKIRNLKKPGSKMSKSDPSAMTRIDLTDDADLVRQKILGAATDSVSRHISYDPEERPGVSNLIDIFTAMTGDKPHEIVEQCKELDKVGFKGRVTEVVNETVQPIRTEMLKLLNDKHYLLKVLEDGAEKASALAETTMREVKQLTGMSQLVGQKTVKTRENSVISDETSNTAVSSEV